MTDELFIEFNNRAKIIAIPSDKTPLRGLTAENLVWPDEEIVDLPPECVKLTNEQKTSNPDRPRPNLSARETDRPTLYFGRSLEG